MSVLTVNSTKNFKICPQISSQCTQTTRKTGTSINSPVTFYPASPPQPGAVEYTDPDGRSEEESLAGPPSNLPGGGENGWKFYPDPNNKRGGVWRPEPTPKGGEPQPDASWEPPHDDTVGHWDVNDGSGKRRRYLPDGTAITPEQAHGKEPLPSSEKDGNTSQYNIRDPSQILKPDITNPEKGLTNPGILPPKNSARKLPILIPVPIPVPGFR
jgi:hypothetical protein